MNRAFYIVGIVFSVVFLFVSGYYSSEVSSAKFDFWYDFDSYGNFSNYDSYSYKELTFEASLWSLFFFLTFIAIDLLGLIKVKTTTAKVFSIIGLSISAIFFFWNFAMMASPGSISFDEVSPAWGFYCFMTLAFSIVGLVQSVRFKKRGSVSVVQSTKSDDLLDS